QSSISVYTLTASLCLTAHPPATGLYPLSLHDALPISGEATDAATRAGEGRQAVEENIQAMRTLLARLDDSRGEIDSLNDKVLDIDRKSTRLNSSHVKISYAVFCLKKKKKKIQ